jgi:hypothetical protein
MADNDADDLPQEEAEQPKVQGPSWFTVSLFVLNIIAALAFAYLLILDYDRRATWSYGVFRHDLSLWGLPLEEEENQEGGWHATKPPQRIDPDKLRAAFTKRRGSLGGSDKFQPVYEVVGQRIKPSQLTTEVLKDLFGKESREWVTTLQQEIKRVQEQLLPRVVEVASETVKGAKDDEDKRKKLNEFLLPLATSTWQIDQLDQWIKNETKKAKGDDLDRILAEAAQRRLLVDLLRVLDDNRPPTPGDQSEDQQKKAAERRALLDASANPSVTLKQLQDQLSERFQEARDGGPGKRGKETYAKRQNIAYLLYAISQMRKPGNPAEFLFPKAAERVQTVAGIYEFILAADALNRALVTAQQRVLAAIASDRGGYPFQGTTKGVVPGFVARHQESVKRIVDLVSAVNEARARLVRLKDEEARSKTQYDERQKDHDAVVEQLIKARQETALHVAELRQLEQQLFQAQVDLADAARNNEQLEREIREAERNVRRKRP